MSDLLVRDGEPTTAQADFLPDIGTGPVAGGAVNLTDEPGGDDLVAGGVLRRWVPTERQLAAEDGAQSEDVEALARAGAIEDTEPRASLGERATSVVRDLDLRLLPGVKLPLIVLMSLELVSSWGANTSILALPEIQASLGLSVAGIITLQTMFQATSFVLGIPLGYLVDRVKRVWLVRLGALGGALGTLLMAFSTSVGKLIGSNALSTATGDAASPASVPLVSDYFPSRLRARAVAFMSLGSQFGVVIGTLFAGWLITQFSWRVALAAVGIGGLVVTALTFLLREPVRGGTDRLELGMDRERAAQAQPAPSLGEAVRGAFAIRTVRLLAFAGLSVSIAQGPVTYLSQIILSDKFLLSAQSRSYISVTAALLAIPSVLVGAVLADRLLKRRPRTLMVAIACVLSASAAMTVVEAFAHSVWLFAAAMVLGAVFAAMLSPAQFTMLSLVIPARYRGLGLQVVTPFYFIGSLISPLVTQSAGNASPQKLFLIYTIFLVIGTFIYTGTTATVAPDIRAARAAALAQTEVDRALLSKQEKILVCRDLDVAYDGVQVLFNVDLDVRKGEVVALVGTNGAGKSTLLRAVSGLQQAANGAVFYDGRDVTASPTYENARRGLIYMPGGQGVFPALTVRENLVTALASTQASGEERTEQSDADSGFERVLDLFPVLRERLDTQAGKLSGGEQQMVALGQAFLMRPRLLMIDELSLGLAPAVIEQLLGVIRAMRADGVTVLLVEQSLNVALTVADRAVFMERGQVHFDGPTEQLLARPDLVRAVFMGGATGGSAVRSRRGSGRFDLADVRLEGQDITVAFGGVNALESVDLSVADGEVLGIIGPNGAGKTTLFDILSGFVRPDSGRILIGGRDVTSLSPDARARLGLGRSFQSARLFPPLTVRENIAVALERKANRSAFLAAVWAPPVRRSERKLQNRVDGFIELLGLIPYADKFVRELSTGTRRAVEVACQMAADPAVLLLDEPSSGLAQAETEALGPALLRIVRETGCAMLVIEHDLPLITSISDRLMAMELGKVLTVGKPEDVVSDPAVLSSYLAASNDVIERSGSRVGSVLATMTGSSTTAAQPALNREN